MRPETSDYWETAITGNMIYMNNYWTTNEMNVDPAANCQETLKLYNYTHLWLWFRSTGSPSVGSELNTIQMNTSTGRGGPALFVPQF